jgi:diamine N-acetyltransferase
LGAIDLFDFDPFHQRAGIGILISNKNDRQQGYASEALQTLIIYSFTVLRLKQLFCSISEDNQQSLRLFIKNGFVITGQKTDWIKKGDDWLTEYFLQLIRK